MQMRPTIDDHSAGSASVGDSSEVEVMDLDAEDFLACHKEHFDQDDDLKIDNWIQNGQESTYGGAGKNDELE